MKATQNKSNVLAQLKTLAPEKAKLIIEHLKQENSSAAECPTWRCSGHGKGGHANH